MILLDAGLPFELVAAVGIGVIVFFFFIFAAMAFVAYKFLRRK